jgi:hypothetical protein
MYAPNPTWTDLGQNPGLRGESPATHRPNHGTPAASSTEHAKAVSRSH